MHEQAYQQLKEKGKVSWDGQSDPNKILDHGVNLALSEQIDILFPQSFGKTAVDLGTGSGTCALYLTQKGFLTTGYDVSKTAIDMAIDNAKTLELPTEFKVADIVSIKTDEKVNLVTDSSLLHCLLGKDRGDFFKLAHNLLDDGYLFLHTMLDSEDMSSMLDKEHLTLKDNILWSTGPDHWEMDWQEVDGRRVFSHRWIATKEMLIEEIDKAGFKVVHQKVNLIEKNPDTFIAWLKKK